MVSSPPAAEAGADPSLADTGADLTGAAEVGVDAPPSLSVDAGADTTGAAEVGVDAPPSLLVDAGADTTGTGVVGVDAPPPPAEDAAGEVVGTLPRLVAGTVGVWPPWKIVGVVSGPLAEADGEFVHVVCPVLVDVRVGSALAGYGGRFAGGRPMGRVVVPTRTGGADSGLESCGRTEPTTWEDPSATAAVASIFATTLLAPRPLTLATVSPPEATATEPPATAAAPAAPVVTLARPPVAAAPAPTPPTVAPPPTTAPVLAVVTPAVTLALAAAAPPPAAAAPPLVTPAPATAAPPPVTPAPVAAAPPAPAPAPAPAATAAPCSTASSTADFRPTARGTGRIKASAARW